MVLIVFIPLLAILLVQASQNYYALNTGIFLAVNHWTLGPDWLWQNITFLGDGLPAFVLLVFFCRRDTRLLWLGLLAALITGLAAQGLKALFDALRPAAVLAPEQLHIIGKLLRHHSFPSGHSATAFVLAGILVQRNFNQQRYPQRLIALGLVTLASVIAWSRVKVGAHWPGDILVGSLLGWYCAQLVCWLDQFAPSIGHSLLSHRLLLALSLGLTAHLWSFDGGYPEAIYLAKILSLSSLIFIAWNVWKQKLWQPAGAGAAANASE